MIQSVALYSCRGGRRPKDEGMGIKKKSCLPQAWVKCEIVLGVMLLLSSSSSSSPPPHIPPLNLFASSFASPLSLRTAQWEPRQDTVQTAEKEEDSHEHPFPARTSKAGSQYSPLMFWDDPVSAHRVKAKGYTGCRGVSLAQQSICMSAEGNKSWCQ